MKLKVTSDYQLQIDGANKPWPSLRSLKPYLPRPVRRNAYNIPGELQEGTLTKDEALRAVYSYTWHRDRVTQHRDGGATLETDHPGSVFLAFGETMYELHPVKSINNSKALALARQKAMTVAKAESASMLELARSEARNTRAEASRTVTQARRLLADHQDATRNERSIGMLNIMPPRTDCKLVNLTSRSDPMYVLYIPVLNQRILVDSWSRGDYVHRLDEPWYGTVNVEMAYVWRNGVWTLRPPNCRLAKATVRPDTAIKELPHISRSSACFSLGTATRCPESSQHVYDTAGRMLGAMSCVNFDSLLSTNVSAWPTGLRVKLGDLVTEYDSQLGIDWTRVEAYVEEHGGGAEAVSASDTSFHIQGAGADSGE
jgi:hypothetical protein